VTLNLVKPIPSLFPGKYFTEMKEHHSPPLRHAFQEAFYSSYWFSSFLFICFISPISFQRPSISLLCVSLFFVPFPAPNFLSRRFPCVPSPGFVFVPRSVNTKPISSPPHKLYLSFRSFVTPQD